MFRVSRKSLYLKSDKQLLKDEFTKEKILDCLDTNPAYGHRRLSMALKFNKKRIKRVMNLNGIKPYKRRRLYRKVEDYGKPESKYQNLIKNICPIAPNVIFAGDFTFLKFNGKFIYLATFLDQFTREIVGWSISATHTKILTINALLDAIKTHGKPEFIHTDQGSEYNSLEFTTFAEKFGIKVSMSKKGSPWENGFQESYYGKFKLDLGLEFERFNTLGEFVEAIHKTVNYYNTTRIHRNLKMSVSQYKQNYIQKFLLQKDSDQN